MIKNNIAKLFGYFSLPWVILSGCDRLAQHPKEEGFQGVIELEERTLGFEVGGRLQSLSVKQGDSISVGELVARLDDSLVKPIRDAREAEKKAAEAKLALLLAGARKEDIDTVAAQLKAARATEANIQSNLTRQESLVSSGAAPSATIDDLSTQLSRAKAERRSLEEKIVALRSGARPEEIQAAEAQIQAAKAALAAEEARLSRYTLSSFQEGSVLAVHFDPGEVLPAGAPLLTVANTSLPYVDIFVPQGALSGINVGDLASVRVDAEANSFCGFVEHISQRTEFTPRYLFSETERPNLVVRVKIRIKDPEHRLHAGVPAFVEIEASSAGGCP